MSLVLENQVHNLMQRVHNLEQRLARLRERVTCLEETHPTMPYNPAQEEPE